MLWGVLDSLQDCSHTGQESLRLIYVLLGQLQKRCEETITIWAHHISPCDSQWTWRSLTWKVVRYQWRLFQRTSPRPYSPRLSACSCKSPDFSKFRFHLMSWWCRRDHRATPSWRKCRTLWVISQLKVKVCFSGNQIFKTMALSVFFSFEAIPECLISNIFVLQSFISRIMKLSEVVQSNLKP